MERSSSLLSSGSSSLRESRGHRIEEITGAIPIQGRSRGFSDTTQITGSYSSMGSPASSTPSQSPITPLQAEYDVKVALLRLAIFGFKSPETPLHFTARCIDFELIDPILESEEIQNQNWDRFATNVRLAIESWGPQQKVLRIITLARTSLKRFEDMHKSNTRKAPYIAKCIGSIDFGLQASHASSFALCIGNPTRTPFYASQSQEGPVNRLPQPIASSSTPFLSSQTSNSSASQETPAPKVNTTWEDKELMIIDHLLDKITKNTDSSVHFLASFEEFLKGKEVEFSTLRG